MGGPSGIAYSIRISIVDYQSGQHPCHIQPFQILSFQAFVAWSYHDAEVFPTIPYSQRIMTVILSFRRTGGGGLILPVVRFYRIVR
jgi:hypothetical protein